MARSNGHETNGNGSSHDHVREDTTASSMPIAVIGLSGRFPGDATSAQKFWDLVAQGRSGLGKVPESRFSPAGFYHPDGARAGSMNTTSHEGYFLTDKIDAFDAKFFSITPQEAKAMDPTQRILLELAYESIENAGLKLEEVAGQRISCFVGAYQHDYMDMQSYDMDASPKYTATGTGAALLANRVSWFFDLKGPSVTVDTACSSAMTALHLACESIRNGGSDSALVGSLNLMLLPNYGVFMTSMSFMSPDDKCHSFDERANGYARGEGGGFVVLKRLDDALRDGDMIRAVIRASGVNQDGRTLGITRPSSQRQEELIRSTYASAGLSFHDTNYFEAHGTGTKVGDPAECSVIGSVFGPTRNHPMLVGSVKSNVGHLEGASAIASLIKVIYSLESGEIPPTIGVEKVNPKIRLSDWKIDIPTTTVPWPRGKRRASINSFGYGGANAHCIIDDAYHFLQEHGPIGQHNTKIRGALTEELADPFDRDMSEAPLCCSNGLEVKAMARSDSPQYPIDGVVVNEEETPARLFVLSSHEESGISRLCQNLQVHVDKVAIDGTATAEEDAYLQRLAYTLAEKRSSLPWKTCFAATSMSDVLEALSTSSSGKTTLKTKRPSKPPHLTFIFTGQGAQWPKMGRELLRYPAFRQSLEASAACLRSLGCGWDLVEELHKDAKTSHIDDSDVSQPACTALQIGILDLLATWGVRPRTVIGHSSGEIAAAYAKESLDREAAMRVSYFRGVLTSRSSRQGAMAAVGLGVQAASAYIAKVSRGTIVVACINSPSSVTVSGDVGGIEELLELLKADNVFARPLRVSTAYHSHHMKLISEAYFASMVGHFGANAGRSNVSMFSSVTAELIDGQELGPEYWTTNLASPVDFSGAVNSGLLSMGMKRMSGHRGKEEHVMLEIGPHAALQGPLKQIVAALGERSSEKPHYLAALKRGQDAMRTFLEAVSELFLSGQPIDFSLVNMYERGGGTVSALTNLPQYAWNRSHSYWAESASTRAYRRRNHPRLELLGARDERSTELEPCWRNYLRVAEQPWIEHHQFQGSNIYPMAGMIVMAIEAMRQQMNQQKGDSLVVEGYHVRDVHVLSALLVPYDESVETRLELAPWRPRPSDGKNSDNGSAKSHWTAFKISSRAESGAWVSNCTGLIAVEMREQHPSKVFGSEKDANDARLATEYGAILHADMPKLDSTVYYTDMQDSGFLLGPCFRGVKELNVLETKSRFSMEVVNTLDWTPARFQPPHLIHPAVLDVFVHVLISSTGGTGRSSGSKRDRINARIPVFCESLYVSADFDSSSGTEYVGHCSSRRRGGSSTDVTTSDVVAFGSGSSKYANKPMIVLRGCRTMPLLGGTTQTEQSLEQVPCLPVLQPDVEMADGDQLAKLLQGLVQAKEDDQATNKSNHVIHASATGRGQLTETNSVKQEEKNVQVNGTKPDGSTSCPRSVAALGYYIALLAHKHAALDILEYKPSAESVMEEIFSLSIRLENDDISFEPVKSCVVTDSDHSQTIANGVSSLPASLSERGTMVQRKKLDLSEDPNTQGFDEDSFDVIILDASVKVEAGCDYSTILSHCQKLLRPAGELLIIGGVGSNSVDLPPNHQVENHAQKGCAAQPMETPNEASHSPLLAEISRSAAFAPMDVNVLSPSQGSRFVVARRQLDGGRGTQKVLLIRPEAASRRLDELLRQVDDGLRGRGYDVTQTSLEGVPDDCSRYLCLAALDIDEAVLEKVDERSASKLRWLFLQAWATLWLTLRRRVDDDGGEEDIRGLADGLGRTIRAEHPRASFTTLSLESSRVLGSKVNVDAICGLTDKVLAHKQRSNEAATDFEYVVQDGAVLIERLLPHRTLKSLLDCTRAGRGLPATHGLLCQTDDEGHGSHVDKVLQLSIRDVGQLDTLEFVYSPCSTSSHSLANDGIELKVCAVGLNARDVAVAMGHVTADDDDDHGPSAALGVECAGMVTGVGKDVRKFHVGERVFGMHAGCFQTQLQDVDPRTFETMPPAMSYEQAASVMCAYATASHALLDVAKLSRGESLLMHSTGGSVGLAAMQLARSVGAGDVFVTVASDEEKQLLVREYGIAASHVFSSRDRAGAFADGVLRLTGRAGVDVVLNLSATGEALRRSWLCLAPFGRFVELANTNTSTHRLHHAGLDMEMPPFRRNLSFAAVDVLTQVTCYPHRFERIATRVGDLLRTGLIAPPPPTALYSFADAERALRLMHSQRHVGNIVLSPNPNDVVPIVLPGLDSSHVDPNATYVLVGGLGGIGRSIANMLSHMGARFLVFLSRSTGSRPEFRVLVDDLIARGVSAMSVACDASDKSHLSTAISDVEQRFPRIKGVIHCAMDLRDAIYENMTIQDWHASLRPKVQATRNLHELLPKDMHFFICLSSVAGIIGSRGQANYNAGNTYQDALMQRRAASGLKATSINLGLVLGIGVSTQRQEVLQLLKGGGLQAMDETDVLNIVKAAISGRAPTQVVMGLSTGGQLQKLEAADPYWFRDSRFAAVRQLNRHDSATTNPASPRNWKSIFAATTSDDDVYNTLLAGVLEGISSVTKLNSEDLDLRKSLPHYGIDSLVAIEIRAWLVREFQADMSVFDIVSNDSLSAFVRKVMAKSALLSPAAPQ